MAMRAGSERRSFPRMAVGAAVIGAGVLALGWWLRNARGGIFGTPLHEGHEAPDLALDQPRPGTGERAPDHFRPDGDAPISAEDREALRPALATDWN